MKENILEVAIPSHKNANREERISLLGAIHSLRYSGIPFNFVERIEDIFRYNVIMLPSLSYLSHLDVSARKYVEQGGGLVIVGTDIQQNTNLKILGLERVEDDTKGEFVLKIKKDVMPYVGKALKSVSSSDATVVGRLTDSYGEYPGIIVHDKIVYFPFELCQAIIEWETETYTEGKEFYNGFQKLFLKMYWNLPACLRDVARSLARKARKKTRENKKFTRWPIESVSDALKNLLAYSVYYTCREGILPTIWRWPSDYKACMMITHDVDTTFGMKNGLHNLLNIEKKYGIKTTWNFIVDGKQYKLDHGVLQHLRFNGMEIAVHGLYHDGLLDKISFNERKDRILQAKQKLESEIGEVVYGFRAPWLLRTNDLWEILEETGYRYDMSFPDTDHLTLHRFGMGVASNMPYHPIIFDGDVKELKMLELPLSSPQDIELFIEHEMSNEQAYKIWEEKMDWIYAHNGLISFLFHPDKLGMGDPDHIYIYDRLLKHAKDMEGLWIDTADEIRKWWIQRENIKLRTNITDKDIEIKINNNNRSVIKGLTLRIILKNKKMHFAKGSKEHKILRFEEHPWYNAVIIEVPPIDAQNHLTISLEVNE
jgi:peptidoglycan/xylan/chitin deacetylase (PgdA/CDA1 family)